MNKTPLKDTDFDEICKLRRDVGGLIKAICYCCGPTTIYSFFSQGLKVAVEKLQLESDVEPAKAGQIKLEALNEIECALFCMTELVKTLKPQELSVMNDVIVLLQQLPETQIALRLTITEFITAISPLMA